MVFKTITDEVTGANKAITFFNSEFTTIQRNLKSKQGIFYSLFGENSIRQSDVDAVKAYVNGIKSGLTPAESWQDNLKGASVAVKQFVLSSKKAGESTDILVDKLNNSTKAAKAGKVAMSALATAGNMLLSWAVSAVISAAAKALDEYIRRAEISHVPKSLFTVKS